MTEGLPADHFSVENDPQLQGIKWIRAREERRAAAQQALVLKAKDPTPAKAPAVTVLQLSEKKWVRKVVSAIQTGAVVIIENLGETIDAVLDPILARSVVRKGKTLFIRLGGDDLEYDPGFRLYLQTRLANPHYKPEVAVQCTLINFLVTEKGLEEELLARVVDAEQPALEKDKDDLVRAFNKYKIQLKDLEDELLFKLANAPADILSDIPLIQGLEKTKATAFEITAAVERGKLAETGINEAREVYRPVAAEASQLYFMLLKLCRIDHMYQYSLQLWSPFFVKFFRNGMASALKSEEMAWVSRGSFEKHCLVFVVQLALGLLQQGAMQIQMQVGYSADGLAFLLRGNRKNGGEEPPAAWVTQAAWEMVQKLSDLEGFEKLPGDLASSAPRFLEWFNHATPETEKLPLDWRDLDRRPFQKLLVVRCLRPDRLTPALKQFVSKLLPEGLKFCDLDSDLSSCGVLEESYKHAGPSVPIYFILSPGANAAADVDRMAKKEGMERGATCKAAYHDISLGQGQDVVAAERLGDGARLGHWVMLNNVHLMPRWLRDFEKLMDGYAEKGCRQSFRLFLSSDPTDAIPVGILDRSIKLTSILFGLCYFHAGMLERRKFGAQGTNMRYPFAVGDLLNSASVLKNTMDNAPAKVPWDDLRYLFGEIMYGGHIVNDFDRFVCGEYLKFFMRDELLDEMELFPFPDVKADYFHAPETSLQYDKVLEHLDNAGRGDSPLAFGLHSNADVEFRTAASQQVCRSILDLAPGGFGGSNKASSAQNVAEGVLQDILEQLREAPFDIDSILSLLDDSGPFKNAFLHECELMNGLLQRILKTLEDLDLGFRGELTISEPMETLQNALFLDRVPQVWCDVTYPSRRPLSSWVVDMQLRIGQLRDWTRAPSDAPTVTWLSGLFQPASFLTAIMQAAAQAKQLELDKLVVYTEISKKMDASDIQAPSKDGAFIVGLFLQGARWHASHSALEAALAGEMTQKMPVINCRAGTATDQDSWILAGTALVMDNAE
ncbi:dynein heavy chain and region D6 of dynein motor-domain-containing protein [Pelagophyceae sp. CCMP2097]|nr:dynein heavy chain and region D6 of dynein motor-domain-containing protein [Pelagophyceae sp. CCMP2097]